MVPPLFGTESEFLDSHVVPPQRLRVMFHWFCRGVPQGLMLHIEDIEELCAEFPETKVMMDHFGFCRPEDRGKEPWERLLGLARFPQVCFCP